jgi:hypothetical protein
MVVAGRLRDAKNLLSPKLLFTEVVVDGAHEPIKLGPDADVNAELSQLLAAGKRIVSVAPRRESLEDLFVREVERSS